MPPKHRWYEKLFVHLQLNEKKFIRYCFGLIVFLMVSQFLLLNPQIRKILLLTEYFEGNPVKFYKSLNTR